MAANIKVQSANQSTGRRFMHGGLRVGLLSHCRLLLQRGVVWAEGGWGCYPRHWSQRGICVERSILFEVINSSKAQFFTWFRSMTLKYKSCCYKILLEVYVVSHHRGLNWAVTLPPVGPKSSWVTAVVGYRLCGCCLSLLLSDTQSHKDGDSVMHSGTFCELLL